MPSPWYLLAAVAYVSFIVLVCLTVAIASNGESDWIDSLIGRILESEESE